MRLSCLMSAVLALAWAASADACCFFKCCNKGGQGRQYETVYTTVPYLKVISVNGNVVPPYDVTAPIDTTQDFTVVLESNPPCRDADTLELSFTVNSITTKMAKAKYKITPTSGIVCRYTVTVPAGTLIPGTTYTIGAAFPAVSATIPATVSPSVTIHTKP